jgi:proteic killer suppression protein
MWEVLEHRRVEAQVARAPVDIQKRYEKWKDIVRFSGPAGLRLIRGLRDESLAGPWKAHRSSRLNQQWRVIYRVEPTEVVVLVVEVTPHDYRTR